MTAHELARQLLEMPDVTVGFWTEYGFEMAQEVYSQTDVKPFGYANPEEPLVIAIGA